jgi:hypothetical protein
MIQAKELMIGNYLYCEYSGEIIQVTEIKNDGVYASSNKTVIERYYYYEEIHSIPIDEKWLTDFGFEKRKNLNNTPTWIYFKDNERWMYQDWETLEFTIRPFGLNNQTEIKYIHQLQNLYYCLVGKELELKHNTK